MVATVFQTDNRSGITYAYQSISYWDKEKQQSRSRRTLIGRVDKETGEIIPTDGRGRKKDEVTKLGVTDDLKQCFPNSYKQILSIAYYLILEDKNPLFRFEKWSSLHKHPYGKNITSQRSSELFASITEEAKNKFFRLQGRRMSEKEFWAYDTTSISSHSEHLRQVQYGKNKENDPLPQFNIAMVFGETSTLNS